MRFDAFDDLIMTILKKKPLLPNNCLVANFIADIFFTLFEWEVGNIFFKKWGIILLINEKLQIKFKKSDWQGLTQWDVLYFKINILALYCNQILKQILLQ